MLNLGELRRVERGERGGAGRVDVSAVVALAGPRTTRRVVGVPRQGGGGGEERAQGRVVVFGKVVVVAAIRRSAAVVPGVGSIGRIESQLDLPEQSSALRLGQVFQGHGCLLLLGGGDSSDDGIEGGSGRMNRMDAHRLLLAALSPFAQLCGHGFGELRRVVVVVVVLVAAVEDFVSGGAPQ